MIRTKLEGQVLEVELCKEPMNEIGLGMLAALEGIDWKGARAVVVHSSLKQGFCAGADLRELYHAGKAMKPAERLKGVREFLKRIHGFLNRLDEAPVPTVAAVHGAVVSTAPGHSTTSVSPARTTSSIALGLSGPSPSITRRKPRRERATARTRRGGSFTGTKRPAQRRSGRASVLGCGRASSRNPRTSMPGPMTHARSAGRTR